MHPLETLKTVVRTLTVVWTILLDVHSRAQYYRLVGLLLVYEGFQVTMSYLMPAILLFHAVGLPWQGWVALGVSYLLLDELYLRHDNRVDWHIWINLDQGTARRLREQALFQLLNLDPAWHEQFGSKHFVAKVNNGIEKVGELTSMVAWEFTPTTIQIVLSLLPLFYFSPLAALLILAICVLFTWQTLVCFSERQPLQTAWYDIDEYQKARFGELAESQATVVAWQQEQRVMDDYCQHLDRMMALSKQEAKLTIERHNRIRFRMNSYLHATIFGIWVYQLTTGAIDVPTFVFIGTLFLKVLSSIWRFTRIFQRAMEASEAVQRLGNLFQEQPQIRGGSYQRVATSPPRIEFRNVWYDYSGEYRNGNGVLRGISFTVEPGEKIAFAGETGAGKSTLFRLLLRIADPQDGEILVDGVPLAEWDLAAWRNHLGEVPQGDRVYIYNETFAQNVAFPNPEADEEQVAKAVNMASLSALARRLPEGYETVVGERGHRLSGGEKQRLAFARSALANRPILLLDEATSAVDAETEQAMLLNMKHTDKAQSTLVIAHRLSTIRDADRIHYLKDGVIAEVGSHDELMKLNGHYARMVRIQEGEVVSAM